MEMHGALGDAGGARGEADQADIVGRRVDRIECRLRRHQRFQRILAVGAESVPRGRRRRRCFQLGAQAVGAQHGVDLRLVGDGAQLARAQQRHGRHGDQAGLHHRQHAGRHHGRVRAAQQHAVAGFQLQRPRSTWAMRSTCSRNCA
jgi:hypothetical protein